jgi:hypothetical protein
LAVLRGLLDGTVRSSINWDSSVVVWWLAESGNAEYLPVFLEGSRVPDTTAMFVSAVYGLVRVASSPAAFQRIEEILRRGSDNARRNTVGLLAGVNHADARRSLRAAMADGLPQRLADQASRALAQPENPHDVALWPPLRRD